jgi:outer membrane scaffolding protein for murein synthesis (MipA/OmpV family)
MMPIRAMSLGLAALLLTAGLPAGGARAQALLERGESIRPGAPTTAWSLTVGALGAAAPDYEGSNDYRFLGAPLIDLRYRNIAFLSSRDGLGVSLVRIGGFTAGPLLRVRFGRDQDDNDALKGLGDVGATVEAGFFANYRINGFNFGVKGGQGLNGGGHRGAEVRADASYNGRLAERWLFSLGPSITWASDNYMDSFFGVNQTQAARSGYGVYNPGGGFKDVGFGGSLTWRFTDQAALTAIAEVKELLNDAADSPIVNQAGSSTQGFVGLALSYRFGW